MKTKLQLAKFGVVAVLLMAPTGCTQIQTTSSSSLQPDAAQMAQQVSPELRMADHKAWINRLIATSPVEMNQQISATSGNRVTLPIPTVQDYTSDGKRYALQLDQRLEVAWLLSTGASGQKQERHGPWRLDNPDVVHLVNSLRPPDSPSGRG